MICHVVAAIIKGLKMKFKFTLPLDVRKSKNGLNGVRTYVIF